MTDDARLSAAREWLATLGIGDADITVASADASFRRYFRVRPAGATFPTGEFESQPSMILMDAPPEREDSVPFVSVARQLAAMALPVPVILGENFKQGFFLLSDLGDTSLLSVLRSEPVAVDSFYRQAGDLLHVMQGKGNDAAANLPPYDEALLRTELGLFRDWLCVKHLELDWDAEDDAQWQLLCDAMVRNALQQPQVYVHRDFHSRNLMVTADASLAIIDFQDAVFGPVTYDLASLLRDCYIAWPMDRVRDWARDWFDDTPLLGGVNEAQKMRWLFLMATQRHIKAAGIFARLGHRDGKWAYLEDVPRTLGYILELGRTYPELSWLQKLIRTRCLPALQA